ncbi:MAG: hypothetical protein ACR2LX_03715 [Jatrophihabitans sp.]
MTSDEQSEHTPDIPAPPVKLTKPKKPKADRPKADRPKGDAKSKADGGELVGAGKAAGKKKSGARPDGMDGKKDKRSEPPPPVATRSQRRGPLVAALAAAVALLAVAAVCAGLYLHDRGKVSDDARTADARTQALATGQKIAIDFSTYDYRHLDQDFAHVAGQLTGKFATDYKATSAALKPTLTQYQGIATAKVLDAGVASLTAKKAVVLVFVDQTVTSKVSKTPTVDRNRVRVTMQRQGDRWLTSALDLR